MRKFDINTFLSDYHMLVSMSAALTNRPDYLAGIFELPANKLFLDHAISLHSFLSEHGFRLSATTADSLINYMQNQGPMTEVKHHIENLHGRICDELKIRDLVIIDTQDSEYYQQPEPTFGVQVDQRFPTSAKSEIADAATCFALDRNTACVFHLMRTMEIGLEAYRLALGIPDPVKPSDRNWGIILRKVADELDRRDRASLWSSDDDKHLFRELYGSINAIKNAWRNSTMHVERVYDKESARHILELVKGFMRIAAGRFDEKGLPLA